MLARYIARRTWHAAWLLFGVSVLSFLLLDLAPGDYFDEARLDPQLSAQTVAGLRHEYGLTRSLPMRYGLWLRSAWHGEFGVSMAYDLPAATLLAPRARNTLLLTVTALLIAWALAIPLGVWSAVRKGRLVDRAIGLVTSVLLAIPELLLACAALFFAARGGWLPAGGMASAGGEGYTTAGRMADLARHMFLPVAVLVLGALPVLLRHTRASMLEVMDAGFVLAAKAHGIPKQRIVWRHMLPVAANPLVSLLGLSIGGLLSGSLLVEVIMGWPGLGPLLLDAVSARDVHVIIGVVLLSGVFLIAGSLLADLLLYALDPRIRVDR